MINSVSGLNTYPAVMRPARTDVKPLLSTFLPKDSVRFGHDDNHDKSHSHDSHAQHRTPHHVHPNGTVHYEAHEACPLPEQKTEKKQEKKTLKERLSHAFQAVKDWFSNFFTTFWDDMRRAKDKLKEWFSGNKTKSDSAKT